MFFSLETELCHNLSVLLDKTDGNISDGCMVPDCAYRQACDSRLGSLEGEISIKWSYYRRLAAHAYALRILSLSKEFIHRAITESFFLEYNTNTHAFQETSFHRLLVVLNNLLGNLINRTQIETQLILDATNSFGSYRHLDNDHYINVDRTTVFVLWSYYVTHKNIIYLSHKALQFIAGNENACNDFDSGLLSMPFRDELERIDSERITPDEARAWVLQHISK